MSIVDRIRQRSRSQWQAYFKERLDKISSFVLERGERGFIVGLIGGIIIVLMFKLVVCIVAAVLLAYFLILAISE